MYSCIKFLKASRRRIHICGYNSAEIFLFHVRGLDIRILLVGKRGWRQMAKEETVSTEGIMKICEFLRYDVGGHGVY